MACKHNWFPFGLKHIEEGNKHQRQICLACGAQSELRWHEIEIDRSTILRKSDNRKFTERIELKYDMCIY